MANLERGLATVGSQFERPVRRAKFFLGNHTGERLAWGEARDLLHQLDECVLEEKDPIAKKARSLIRENTLAIGNSVCFRLSAYHRDTFLRDLFLVRQFADAPLMDKMGLDMFADAQDKKTGQMPTSIFAFGKEGFRFPDESTLYYPIFAWQAEVENGVELSPKHIEAVRRAVGYITRRLDSNGFLYNDPVLHEDDRRTYWADELMLPEADVVAFKQGLAAVALRAAFSLGITEDLYSAAFAEKGYRRLAEQYDGRLPLSLKTGWRDVSALYPEYLSIVLFNQKMLDDAVVKNTIASFATRTPEDTEIPDVGFRVILDEEGGYIPEDRFIAVTFPQEFMDTPGRYQNGGTWLIWDHAAWVVGRLHGIDDFRFLPQHVRNVFNGNYIKGLVFGFEMPEYLYTGRFYGERFDDPSRTGQTWDATIMDQRRRMEKYVRDTITPGSRNSL